MTKDEPIINSMRVMSLPIWNRNLILPSVSIAEISPYKEVQVIDGSPDWFMGMMEWRGTDLPLTCIESISDNESTHFQKKSQVAVINMINENIQFPFVGIFIQGLPRMMAVEANELGLVADTPDTIYAMTVLLNEQEYVIPNLEMLQKMVEKFLGEKGLLFSMDFMI